MNDDRTVHARLADGAEVVRYDRSGKWYLEPVTGRRRLLPLAEAVSLAAARGATRYWHRHGGLRFDAELRRLGRT